MIDIDTLKKQPKYAKMSKSSLRKVAAYQQLCQDAIALFGHPSKRYPMAKLVKMYKADLENREKQIEETQARDAQNRKRLQAKAKPKRKAVQNTVQSKAKGTQNPRKGKQVVKSVSKSRNRRRGGSARFTAASAGSVYNVPVKSILNALCHGKEVKVVRRVKATRKKSPWSNLYFDKHLWRSS